MKLISLNAWGGRLYEPLEKFIKHHAVDVDIFCFQEMRNGEKEDKSEGADEIEDLFSLVSEMLPNFIGYFAKQVEGIGSAAFVKNTIKVERGKSFQIIPAKDLAHLKRPNGNSYYPRIMQVVSLKDPEITIYNFHGIPGNKKRDTPERDLQTRLLIETLDKDSAPKILVGDFNLDMDTNAVSVLGSRMRNLVQEGGFATTRNHYYEDYLAVPFSDYAFVSRDISVKSFSVLDEQVSDHTALLIEIS